MDDDFRFIQDQVHRHSMGNRPTSMGIIVIYAIIYMAFGETGVTIFSLLGWGALALRIVQFFQTI